MKPAFCHSRPVCFAISSLLLPSQKIQTRTSMMSEMAATFLMLLWQGQGILVRPSSKTLVESLYEKHIQATIICSVQQLVLLSHR